MKNKALVVIDIQNDITNNYRDIIGNINEFYITGADAVSCVKSTYFNMRKENYNVHVLSDCIVSYDPRKIDEMLVYYASKGCTIKRLREVIDKH